ncbi:MAG: hypothetical protein ACOCUI_01995 [bacterium]
MDLQSKLLIIEQKIKILEEKDACIFNQLTELRTIIQSIYNDNSQNNRYCAESINKVNNRIDNLYNKISEKENTTNFNLSSQINPNMSHDSSNHSSKSEPKDPSKDKKNLFGMNFEVIVGIFFAGALGLIILIGIISIIIYKIFSALESVI